MRTRTILRMIYHAPITMITVLLFGYGKPKPPRKDYAMIIMACTVIAVFGLALSFLLN